MTELDTDELLALTWTDWIETNGEVIDRAEGISLLLDRVREAEAERDDLEAQRDQALNTLGQVQKILTETLDEDESPDPYEARDLFWGAIHEALLTMHENGHGDES